MTTGRPTKLDATIAAKIFVEVRKGQSLTHACGAARVHRSTVYDWIAKGEALEAPPEDAEFVAFALDLNEARAYAAGGMVRTVRVGGERWQGPAFLLERLYPQEFGKRQVLEHVGAEGGPMQHEVTARVVLLPPLDETDADAS